MLAYAHIYKYKLDILPIFWFDLKFRLHLFFLLYSAWDLVDGLSTYNFGKLGSFTPFTNHHIFNKHTYRENMTQIESEKHWNSRWQILTCITFVFARKAYLHIEINCRLLVIWEGMNVNCDVPGYGNLIHSRKACVLDLAEYHQWSFCVFIHWYVTS